MIDGSIIIGAATHQSALRFRASDATTGTPLGQTYSEAGRADVDAAAALAAAAAPAFAAMAPADRARLLEAVAKSIEAIGDGLIVTAMAESGLPRVRLEGERGRACGQLRLFAAELRRGAWLDVTIDRALPERSPPRPDLRRMNQALGPVAVFGASNFPLAFSVAGGDAASALAAGCPVIVKGHPAHPGTGELAARAVARALAACGLEPGVFSYLPGSSHELGAALVADPRVKAVGFTGSRSGGLALARIAASRAEPIPFYAEMSAVNPVILLPGALAEGAEALAAGFVGSLTLGAGQFCTNPGLLLAVAGEGLDRFRDAAAVALGASVRQVMLTPGIASTYAGGVAALEGHAAVERVGSCPAGTADGAAAALFETNLATFLADPALASEVFGAAALLVRCPGLAELEQALDHLEGQLTATVHAAGSDAPAIAGLLPRLAEKAGRVLANGWPTGVEVSPAMVHGGPFPATTDGRSTSVGTLAIARFLRPVCWQNIGDALLPPPLQEANPWQLPRTIDGVMEVPA